MASIVITVLNIMAILGGAVSSIFFLAKVGQEVGYALLPKAQEKRELQRVVEGRAPGDVPLSAYGIQGVIAFASYAWLYHSWWVGF